MAKPFSLQPLLEIMQERTDEATRRLGKLIAAERDARSRLQMLEQYREEYAARMAESRMQGMTPMALRNYQAFLARIDEAIQQQAAAVMQSEQQTAHGQEQWKAQNKQLKAVDTLATRHEARERAAEAKREQKLTDEFSSRRFAVGSDSEPDR